MYNYAIDHNGNSFKTVFRFDRNWQNGTALFQLNLRGSGISYDAGNNSLWVTTSSTGGAPNGPIQQYSMTGELLSEFPTTAIGSYHYGLAFDNSDRTLWTSDYGVSGMLYQFDTSGNLLRQIPIPGQQMLYAFGMEFGAGPATVASTPVPALSAWGLSILALMIALLALGWVPPGPQRSR